MASVSACVSFEKAGQGITGDNTVLFGRTPVRMAVDICCVVQLPRPVSGSGVRFLPTTTPPSGNSKPTSEPDNSRLKSGLPKKCPGVWQSLQPATVTKYL